MLVYFGSWANLFFLFKCPYVVIEEAIVTTMVPSWFCVTVT